MNIVISQPRYLPALNYLQRLYFADFFVVLDTVQRQARGWENRNKLLVPDPAWLTIPIASSSRELIVRTTISDRDWVSAHQYKISSCYKEAPYFDPSMLSRLYDLSDVGDSYVDVLVRLIMNISEVLSFSPALVRASELLSGEVCSGGVEMLSTICKRFEGSTYVSGPNGRDYGVGEEFGRRGIPVRYHDFSHPIYDQRRDEFHPYMGFLDALFFCGVEWLSNFVRMQPELSEK